MRYGIHLRYGKKLIMWKIRVWQREMMDNRPPTTTRKVVMPLWCTIPWSLAEARNSERPIIAFCLYLHLCLPACLSACLPACLPNYLPNYLTLCLSACLPELLCWTLDGGHWLFDLWISLLQYHYIVGSPTWKDTFINLGHSRSYAKYHDPAISKLGE